MEKSMIEEEKIEDTASDDEVVEENNANSPDTADSSSEDWDDFESGQAQQDSEQEAEAISDESEEIVEEQPDGQESDAISEKAEADSPAEDDKSTDQESEAVSERAEVESPADDEQTPQGEDEEEADDEPGASSLDENIEVTVETVVEAVLFASDESLTPLRLANIVESTVANVKQSIKSLNEKYKADNRAFRIERLAGGYQMLTLSVYNVWLTKLLRARAENKLSPAALETLAIISYKQPIIRADIESIRGVAAGEMVRSLMYKGLVKIVGRAEVLGRPMLYGTTKKFLEIFGLNSLKDLPKNEELKKPTN
jgi:segregation and condensation protein B